MKFAVLYAVLWLFPLLLISCAAEYRTSQNGLTITSYDRDVEDAFAAYSQDMLLFEGFEENGAVVDALLSGANPRLEFLGLLERMKIYEEMSKNFRPGPTRYEIDQIRDGVALDGAADVLEAKGIDAKLETRNSIRVVGDKIWEIRSGSMVMGSGSQAIVTLYSQDANLSNGIMSATVFSERAADGYAVATLIHAIGLQSAEFVDTLPGVEAIITSTDGKELRSRGFS